MSELLRDERSRIENRLKAIGEKLWGARPLFPDESLTDLKKEQDALEEDLRRNDQYLQDHE